MSSNKRVGNYELVAKLGSGSYAQVFKGVHLTTNELVAVKAISKEKIGDPKSQENLHSEIAIMRDYQHPNIVRLYEHFNSSKSIYLILELCPGGDLSKYIKRCRRIDEHVAQRFLRQLSDGLLFLNQRNLIHRDLKPANVLLSEASENAILKLADFGFAKVLAEASLAQTPCGTPLYMAPEIFEHQDYDAKADLWSVGCIFYEMMIGTYPFKGSNTRELYTNIKTKGLSIPNDIVLSTESLVLLQRLLERNPARRVSLQQFHDACRFLPVINNQQSSQTRISTQEINAEWMADRPNNSNQGALSVIPEGTSNGSSTPQKSIDRADGRGINPSTATTMLSITGNNIDNKSQAFNKMSPTSPPVGAKHLNQSSSRHNNTPYGNKGQVQSTTSSPMNGNYMSNHTRSYSADTGELMTRMAGLSIQNDPQRQNSLNSKASKNFSPLNERNHDNYSPDVLTLPPSISVGTSNYGGVYSVSPSGPTSHTRSATLSGLPPSPSNQQTSRYYDTRSSGIAGFVKDEGRKSARDNYHEPYNSSAFGTAIDGFSQANGLSHANEIDSSDDDFVIVEQAPSHPWRASPNSIHGNNANVYANEFTSFNNTSKGRGGNGTNRGHHMNLEASQSYTAHSSQQTIVTHIQSSSPGQATQLSIESNPSVIPNFVHECFRVSDVLSAITFIADNMARDALGRTKPQHVDNDPMEMRPRLDSESSSKGSSTIVSLSGACSLYLHALTLLQDTIQRVESLEKQMQTVQVGHEQTNLLQKLQKNLMTLFDQLLLRTEQCHEMLLKHYKSDTDGDDNSYDDPVTTMPIPESLMYAGATTLAREASVEELLGNLRSACTLYSTAVLLIEAVMLTAADSTDRRTLQTFADAFKDQLNACKQRSSLLFQPIAGQSQYATGMTFGTVPSTISTQFFALN